jgi:Putative cyclase
MCLPGTVETVRENIEAERASGASKGLTRRATFAGAGATALAALLPSSAAAHPHSGGSNQRYQDLTHVFTAGFPVYVGDPPTRSTLVTVEADGFYKQQWTFDEHSGTHMDAPGHFIADGRRTPELRPEELFAHAARVGPSGCPIPTPTRTPTPPAPTTSPASASRPLNGCSTGALSGGSAWTP